MFFNNYRPVPLLCSLSKVLENIMYNRVISFLDDNKILFEYQFVSLHLPGINSTDGQIDQIYWKWRSCGKRLSWFLKSIRYRQWWNLINKIKSLWNTWTGAKLV